MINEDFDVVKKGEIHQPSFNKGKLEFLLKAKENFTDLIKDLSEEINRLSSLTE